MNDILPRLVSVYGPSGRESQVADLIRELIGPWVDEIRVDALGNVIAGPTSPSAETAPIMLSAHLDQSGLVVTDLKQDGLLRFSAVGGLIGPALTGLQVRNARGAVGVIGLDEGVEVKDLAPGKMFIDLGVSGRDAAARLAGVGDVFCPVGELKTVGDAVVGPALDNRAGCAVLIEVARRLRKDPRPARPAVYYVFSVQGAVGPRGARPVAFALQPGFALTIDLTPAGGSRGRSPVEPGRGPAVRLKDATYVVSGRVRDLVERAARAAEIPVQPEVLPTAEGHSDAAGVELVRDGVPTGMIGIPARHLGTASELVHRSDLDAAAGLVAAVVDALD